jgi:hypothetical protein
MLGLLTLLGSLLLLAVSPAQNKISHQQKQGARTHTGRNYYNLSFVLDILARISITLVCICIAAACVALIIGSAH